MWMRAAVMVSCLWLAVPSFATTESGECLSRSLRAFERELANSNDPQLRADLVRCVEKYRDDVLDAKRQIASSGAAVKSLSEEVAALPASEQESRLKQIALRIGEAGRALDGAEQTVKEGPAKVEELEKVVATDLKRLSARIAVLEKLEADAQLDDATAAQLENLRRSRRALQVIARAAGDDVKFVADAFVEQREKDKKKKAEAEEAERAQKAEAAARRECADRNSHVRNGNLKDAAAIERCIDALQKALYPLEAAEQARKEDENQKQQGGDVQVASLGSGYAAGAQSNGGSAQQAECDRKCEKAKAAEKERAEERLRLQLARFEEAARSAAARSFRQLSDLEKKTNLSDAEKEKKKALEAELATLRKHGVVPGEDPQTEFADYEQWFNKFSTGYEYASISEAFGKGFPRMGATIGFHYPRNALPEHSPRNWHFYGVYSTFTVSLTNTAETSASKFPPDPGTPPPPDPADEDPPAEGEGETPDRTIKRALEFESQFFAPLWRNDLQILNRRLRTRIGPIAVFGARKSDEDLFSHHRAYVGLRTARSPDTFADLMIGRSGGLRSRRIELRGQYSLPQIINGGRIIVGATGNFGVNKRRRGDCDEAAPGCRLNEPDSIRFFASYEISGGEILKWFGVGN